MKEWISKYQKTIVGTGAIAVLVISYLQQKELSTLRSQLHTKVKSENVDSLTKVIDSLSNENFINNNMVGRYELSLKNLYEINPTAAKQFDNYLQNETE